MTSLSNILETAGSGLEHLLQATVYPTELESRGVINEVFAEFLDEHHPPERWCPRCLCGLAAIGGVSGAMACRPVLFKLQSFGDRAGTMVEPVYPGRNTIPVAGVLGLMNTRYIESPRQA